MTDNATPGEAVEEVVKACAWLLRDEAFAEAVAHPTVRAALDHWTGRKRIATEEAEARFNEDFRVRDVFGKLRVVQEVCARAGVGVPLDAILRGDLDEVRTAVSRRSLTMPSPAAARAAAAVGFSSPSPASSSESPRSAAAAAGATTTSSTGTSLKTTPAGAKPAKSVTFSPDTPAPRPPKSSRQTKQALRAQREHAQRLANHEKHGWTSLHPQNVSRWWTLQFFVLGLLLARFMGGAPDQSSSLSSSSSSAARADAPSTPPTSRILDQAEL